MNFFSTDQIPRQHRLSVLHDFVGRQVARRQFRPLDDELAIDLGTLPLTEDAMVAQARYSPIAGARTRDLVADGRDGYLLTVHDADSELAVEGRAPVRVRAGDMMLVSEAALSEFRLPHVRVTVVQLGFREMLARVPRIQSQPFHHIPAGTPAIGLITGYADLLLRNPVAARATCGHAAGHLHDLAAMALGSAPCDDAADDRPGVSAARLALIKREIERHLGEPGLTVGAIARQQGVTPRYVQRLFEREGTTFSDHVRDRRLDLAHAILSRGRDETASISAIAYDCGFGDLSHFNRSFRKRFGQRPSDVRAAAMLKRNN